MKTYQIKLTPLSSFHNLPASDTLFSAICWGIKRIYGEDTLINMLKEFENNPRFVLSSSFPYIEHEGKGISFYPKLVTKGLPPSDIDEMAKHRKEKVKVITAYKKFKKAEYISASLFERILKGAREKDLFTEFYRGELKLEGGLLIEREYEHIFKSKILFKSDLVQKNAIDRVTMSTGEEGQTFYQEEYFAGVGFNLHFLMKTTDIDFFKSVFRYLEDKGIGGNRSTGKGRFKIKVIGEVSIGKENYNRFVTFSRYIPDTSEINIHSDFMLYEIFPYRSKVDSEAEFKGEDIWKSRIIYVKEGSRFEANTKKEFYGKVPIVKEIGQNLIYQNGLAFPVFGNFWG